MKYKFFLNFLFLLILNMRGYRFFNWFFNYLKWFKFQYIEKFRITSIKTPQCLSFIYPNMLPNFSKYKNKLFIFYLFCNNYFIQQNSVNYLIRRKINRKKFNNNLSVFFSINLLAELIFFGKKNLSSLLLNLLLLEFDIFKNKIISKSCIVENYKSIIKDCKDFRFALRLIRFRRPHMQKIAKKRAKLIFFENFISKIKHRKDPLTINLLKTLGSSKNIKFLYNSILEYKSKRKLKIYDDYEIHEFFDKLVSLCTKRGSKKKAYKLITDGFLNARKELNLKLKPKTMILFIFKKIDPVFILKKFTFGRRTVIIPFPMRKEKLVSHTARLFLNSLKKRTELSFKRKLTEEIKDFFKKGKKPYSFKAKNDRIKLAFESKGNLRFLRLI